MRKCNLLIAQFINEKVNIVIEIFYIRIYSSLGLPISPNRLFLSNTITNSESYNLKITCSP